MDAAEERARQRERMQEHTRQSAIERAQRAWRMN
jgi:hypothetical protein